MKAKILTLSLAVLALGTVALAKDGAGSTVPLSDPELVGLRSSLPSTDAFKNPSAELFFSRRVDAKGHNFFDGSGMFAFQGAHSPLHYVFSMRRISDFKDDGLTVWVKGSGSMYNSETKSSMDVLVELKFQDNRNSGSAPGTPGDLFAIHFWKEKSDFNVIGSWNGADFKSVEIYRP